MVACFLCFPNFESCDVVELKMNDITELLQVTEKEVLRLIRNNGMPAHKINHRYMFSRHEIKQWILQSGVDISTRMLESDRHVSVAELVRKGGVLGGITGNTPSVILAAAVAAMKLPDELSREEVLLFLLQREEMMPTSVGRGIAIPHPRKPIVADMDNESITVVLLAEPVDYSALDKKPVHTLFIVLSANSNRHLEILSRLTYLCQKPDFVKMLENAVPADDLVAYIEQAEAGIRAGGE